MIDRLNRHLPCLRLTVEYKLDHAASSTSAFSPFRSRSYG